jgi:glycosyltransferase involved in cell wall biosynthesis
LENLKELPLVSFVIPTLNSERTIRQCLESMKNQDYPNLEIVIVDGGSYDSTVKISSLYTSKIFLDKGPLAHARQTGANNSIGRIMGIFDSNVVLPSSDWLRKAVQQFDKCKNIGVVWPLNKAPQNASIVSRCYFNFWNKRLNSTMDALPGGNSLVLREPFSEVNGFNVRLHFGEDLDLMRRIISRGYNVVVFNYPIIHDSMHTLKEFTRKQIWGASSLFDIKDDEFRAIMLDSCMTWRSAARHIASPVSRHAFTEALMKHILIGFHGMTRGLAKGKDYSWVIFPLLLSIRSFVYGAYYLKSKLFHK